MKLYHGSSVSVPLPLTTIGRRELDFGPGFYLTNLREQAERWANRVCVFRTVNTPTVSTYEFDEALFPANMHCLHFEQCDQNWLDFIVSSFRGEEPWKYYDFIEGSIADEQVANIVKDYSIGHITANRAMQLLGLANPTHQICIRNQTIIDRCLRYVGMDSMIEKMINNL